MKLQTPVCVAVPALRLALPPSPAAAAVDAAVAALVADGPAGHESLVTACARAPRAPSDIEEVAR